LLVAADNEMMMDDDDDDDDVMMWATESNMPTTEKNRITAVANIAADITKQFLSVRNTATGIKHCTRD
jgi:hypothetical protein